VLTAALTSWCWCQLALVPLYAVAAWRGNLMAFARQLTAPPGDR
jgi:hypothetical protein